MFIKVWNATSGKLKYTFENTSSYGLTRLGETLLANQYISSDGVTLGPIIVWNFTTGEVAFNLTGHTDVVLEIRELLGSNLIQTKSFDNTTRIWSLTTGELLYTLSEMTYTESSIYLYPSLVNSLCSLGQNLTASASMSSIRIWNATTGKLKFTLEQDTTNVWSVVKLENGLLASSYGFFVPN